MKRAIRFTAYAMLAVVAALVLGTVVPRPFFSSHEPADKQPHRILVLANPIHTDIAIPIQTDLLERFDFLRSAGLPIAHPGARYLVFGWGSRAFYLNTPTWSELQPGPVLSALTLDDSVMHVSIAGDISEAHPAVAGLDLAEPGFEHLLAYVEQGFRQGTSGPLKVAGAAYGDYDVFFEANGYFNALAGCNTWTAGALRAAGLKTGWWIPLPTNLFYSLRLLN